MFENFKKYWIYIFTFFLVVLNIYLFRIDWQNTQKSLTFAMLDVGQGDSIFIESPTGTQVMFDAGPKRKILGPLSRVMSPFDRTIDAVIITNPDADHIGGFEEVINKYKIGQVFESGALTDSKMYQNIKKEMNDKNVPSVLARKGTRLDIGGGAFIDILFPDRDVSEWATNDGSVVARLSYGDISVMLTGDAMLKSEKIILSENKINYLDSTFLKVGHHGSRTSTSEEFLKSVSPIYAFISDGKDNNYGHPHKETLDILNKYYVKVLRTDLLGTIIMKTNGQKFDFSFH